MNEKESNTTDKPFHRSCIVAIDLIGDVTAGQTAGIPTEKRANIRQMKHFTGASQEYI